MSPSRSRLLAKKAKPFTFRPPKNNRFVIRLIKRLILLILRQQKIVAVEVNEEDLRSLEKLKGQRVVLTPNHPGGVEPAILFYLSRILGEEFNYLAAKSLFERRPLVGWLLQRLGVYSIVKGSPDKSSFRMTRQLLVDGKRWLVIFPEGEVCWQNDTVMPFQQGVAQFAFWAYEDLAKRDKLPPIYFVPVAIKYIYLRDMRFEIGRSLQRLEQKLNLTANSQPSTLYDRLRRVGEAVLSANEKKFNVRLHKGANFDERVQHMKELVLSRVAEALGVSLHPDQPLLWRIRDLFNAFDRIAHSDPEGSDYEGHLQQQRQQEAQALYDDLWRVLYFVAVYDGYVRETLTTERFLDVLGRLELEVFSRKRIWGPRKAVVKIGEPLNLADYFPKYKSDKQVALRDVTTSLEGSVQELLAELLRLTPVTDPVE